MFLFVPECISLFSSFWSDPMWNVILSARQLEFRMVGNMQASLKLVLTGLVCGLRFWCNVKRLEYTVRSFLTYSLHFWSSEMPLDKYFIRLRYHSYSVLNLIWRKSCEKWSFLRVSRIPNWMASESESSKTNKIQW